MMKVEVPFDGEYTLDELAGWLAGLSTQEVWHSWNRVFWGGQISTELPVYIAESRRRGIWDEDRDGLLYEEPEWDESGEPVDASAVSEA